jgi:hypothetical protein
VAVNVTVYWFSIITGALVITVQESVGMVADGKIYYTARGGRTVVVAASPKFEKLAENTLESNRGVFNSTPAMSGARLLLRSNRALYCLGR